MYSKKSQDTILRMTGGRPRPAPIPNPNPYDLLASYVTGASNRGTGPTPKEAKMINRAFLEMIAIMQLTRSLR